jgi:hypothetical protein
VFVGVYAGFTPILNTKRVRSTLRLSTDCCLPSVVFVLHMCSVYLNTDNTESVCGLTVVCVQCGYHEHHQAHNVRPPIRKVFLRISFRDPVDNETSFLANLINYFNLFGNKFNLLEPELFFF